MNESMYFYVLLVVVFVLAGVVKGVTGMGLPTVAMGLLGGALSPVAAASMLFIPTFVTNAWQLLSGPSLGHIVRRLWPMMLAVVVVTLGSAALLVRVDRTWSRVALGVALVVYAAYALLAPVFRVPQRRERWLGPLVESPRLLMLVMMLVLVLVGTALDLTPTILIFAPVMLPIAVKAGIDPVYFGLMFVLNGAIGLITPPVGTVLNVVAGVGRLPLHRVIQGVNPFLITYVLILLLFVLFPQIVTAPVAWMR